MLNPILKYSFALVLGVLLVSGCNRNPQYDTDPKSEQQSGTCAVRLKMMDAAKKLWAEQNGKTANDTPKLEDLETFMRGNAVLPHWRHIYDRARWLAVLLLHSGAHGLLPKERCREKTRDALRVSRRHLLHLFHLPLHHVAHRLYLRGRQTDLP